MKLIENEAAGLGFFGSGEASRGLRTMGMMRGRTGGRSPTPTARGTPDR